MIFLKLKQNLYVEVLSICTLASTSEELKYVFYSPANEEMKEKITIIRI